MKQNTFFVKVGTFCLLVSLSASIWMREVDSLSILPQRRDFNDEEDGVGPTYTSTTSNLFIRRPFNHKEVNKNIDTTTTTLEMSNINDLQFSDDILEDRSFFPRYSLLLQVLIFICCAAGVSAIIILCCLVCLHSLQYFSRSTVIVDNDGRVHMMTRNVSNNETVLTYVPVHRHHPWSLRSGGDENRRFHFQLEGEIDKPPAYDDLSVKEEDPTSPPPPPYTPSFRLPENSGNPTSKPEGI